MFSSKNIIFKVLLADNDAIVCVKSAMINENGRSATQRCCYYVETFAVLIFLFCSSIDVGGGDHFGGADPDAAPLDDGEVLHYHQCHPHFYFPLYWF